MAMSTRRAAIYIRRSTEEQSEYSTEAQERQCRSYAEILGFEVYRIYIDDDYSGRRADRPSFNEMIRDAHLKRFSCIIAHKIDRLARNTALLLKLVEDMEAIGVGVLSVSEQIDFRTPMGKVSLAMLASFAQYYSDNLGTETKKGLQEKAMQGGWVGPVPYGYERDGSTLRPSNDAPAVQLIFSLYTSGSHSYTSLADELNQRGWRTLDWKTGERGLFGRENIRYILRNKAYIGMVSINDQEYPGKHPALVSKETFELAQSIREHRTHKKARFSVGLPETGGLLTELVWCAKCGERMWRHTSAGDGNRKRRIYYVCSGRSRRTCDAPFVSAQVVEDQAISILQQLAIPTDWRDRILTIAEGMIGATQEVKVISPEQIDEQKRRLSLAFSLGGIDEATYRRQLESLQALKTARPKTVSQLDLVSAVNTLTTIGDALKQADPEMQRLLIRRIISKFWLSRGKEETNSIEAITPTGAYAPLVEATTSMLSMGWLMGLDLAYSPTFRPFWNTYREPIVL